jgi:C-terminal processing protease CtpA/Prc
MNANKLILAMLACIGPVVLTSARAFSDEFAPDRYGIGATLVQPDDSTFIEIRQVSPNGPSARAGLEVGDRILELDGKPIREWSFDQVLDYLIRSEPLPLRVTVRRGEKVVAV